MAPQDQGMYDDCASASTLQPTKLRPDATCTNEASTEAGPKRSSHTRLLSSISWAERLIQPRAEREALQISRTQLREIHESRSSATQLHYHALYSIKGVVLKIRNNVEVNFALEIDDSV